MKTAAKGNQNCSAIVRSKPSSWSGRQESSCSIMRAGKQENIRPREEYFFLTFPSIELTGQVKLHLTCHDSGSLQSQAGDQPRSQPILIASRASFLSEVECSN